MKGPALCVRRRGDYQGLRDGAIKCPTGPPPQWGAKMLEHQATQHPRQQIGRGGRDIAAANSPFRDSLPNDSGLMIPYNDSIGGQRGC
jgi:hypothetical protein